MLLERDLGVLHEGVVEGRCTVVNIGKYILMASSANLGNIMSMVDGPISTLFDVLTFGVLLLLFRATVTQFRTGWFIESLVTQILMIFAVRTRHNLFASRPHVAVTLLAIGCAALTLALPFLPMGVWFEFVAPTGPYYLFLALVVLGS